MPKDSWLCAKEKKSIISFLSANRGDGYRRCAYMMIDKDVAYASPSTVYRFLNEAGMLQKKAKERSFTRKNRDESSQLKDESSKRE